jgi:hypothetical protein
MAFNYKLAIMDHKELTTLGFTRCTDGTDDPRGMWYELRIGDYVIRTDAWYEVTLTRYSLGVESDEITVCVENGDELKALIAWAAH